MHGLALLLVALVAGVNEYPRRLDIRSLDQASFDAETYGVKKALVREGDGLRITLEPGADETGWKTPAALKIGGDFTITANVVIRKLPKPAQEDGAAVGMAIAQGDLDHPDLTLMRLKEPGGADVYRAVDRGGNHPGPAVEPGGLPFMMPAQGQPGAKPVKPPRRVFPAAGDAVRLEFQREKDVVRFQVLDATMDRPRYLGQITLGTNDISAVKLFVSNRNGAEPLDVLWRDVTIRADRLGGLGTTVRTVFDTIVYADPTAIENGLLILGGPPRTPSPTAPASGPAPASAAPGRLGSRLRPCSCSCFCFCIWSRREPKPREPKKSEQPRARIPLDEVESVRFERTDVLTARFLGQKNVDLTRPAPSVKKDESSRKVETDKASPRDGALAPPPGTTVTKVARFPAEKNGIRDVGLALSGLRTAKVKQVTVNCPTEPKPTAWRLDTVDSHDWPLVLWRAGEEPWAEIYLEPPPGDSFQKDYQINVVYDDGQNGNVTAKADEHTDSHRAVDPRDPAVPRPGATVHLTGEEKLFGTLEEIGPEALRLTCPWRDQRALVIPLERVVGVQLRPPDRKESPESFARRLKSRGGEDVLLARTKDGEVLAIQGVIEGTEGDRLLFHFQDRTRTVALGQVEGWVMAARPEPRPLDGLRARVSLFGGLVLSSVWKDLDNETWTLEAPWGQELKVPAALVHGVRFQRGAMTYLCDLDPSRVEETPFFSHRFPWRRDVGLLGEPLRMAGQTYEHGVAVHSRCRLTYDLNGDYDRFEALLGFDDAAGRGRVDCRVARRWQGAVLPDRPPSRTSPAGAGGLRGGRRAASARGRFWPRTGYG